MRRMKTKIFCIVLFTVLTTSLLSQNPIMDAYWKVYWEKHFENNGENLRNYYRKQRNERIEQHVKQRLQIESIIKIGIRSVILNWGTDDETQNDKCGLLDCKLQKHFEKELIKYWNNKSFFSKNIVYKIMKRLQGSSLSLGSKESDAKWASRLLVQESYDRFVNYILSKDYLYLHYGDLDIGIPYLVNDDAPEVLTKLITEHYHYLCENFFNIYYNPENKVFENKINAFIIKRNL